MFQDRLVNDEDRQWFDDISKQKMKEDFGVEFDDVVTQNPLLYGDFMTGDTGNYEEITDQTKVSGIADADATAFGLLTSCFAFLTIIHYFCYFWALAFDRKGYCKSCLNISETEYSSFHRW